MVLAKPAVPAMPVTAATLGELQTLAVSWRRALRAQNKSPRTIVGYLEGVRFFDDYLRRMGMPRQVTAIRREHVEGFVAEQLDRFRPSTARTRFRSCQQFFRYLVEEGELRASPMANMAPPAIPDEPPAILSDDQLRKLLRACEGRSLADRRDLALLRIFLDTGARLSEIADLRLVDLDLEQDVAIVLGKGRRPRVVPFGAKTAAALDRYLRARATHSAAASERLWLGYHGPMTGSGIRKAIVDRGRAVGVAGLHPHLLRHVAAHRWLAAGGQEVDAMRLFGWRSRSMISRYGASAAAERARDAHRRLALGDQL